MVEATQFRRASAAQPKLPPPQKKVEEDLAAKLGADANTLHLLITHAKGSAFWRGTVIGGIIGGLFIGSFVLFTTTALFDPISKSAGQNVATGAAIAAQDGR